MPAPQPPSRPPQTVGFPPFIAERTADITARIQSGQVRGRGGCTLCVPKLPGSGDHATPSAPTRSAAQPGAQHRLRPPHPAATPPTPTPTPTPTPPTPTPTPPTQVQYPSKMSDEQRDFVQWTLQRAPADRPTVAEMLQHPWVTMLQVRGRGGGGGAAAAGQGGEREGLQGSRLQPARCAHACSVYPAPPQRRNSSRNLNAGSGDGGGDGGSGGGGSGGGGARGPARSSSTRRLGNGGAADDKLFAPRAKPRAA
jgi:hypothetical protein